MSGSGSDDDDGRISPVSRPRGSGAVDSVDGIASASEVAGVAAVSTQAITRIAAALAAGSIDAAAARDQLIDETVRATLPAGAGEDAARALRERIAETLDGDPVLERLLAARA